MATQNLIEFAKDNSAMLDILGSEDTLFFCAFIARNGYTQTAEFRQEVDAPSSQIRSALHRLVDAEFVAYQNRPGGIFNGWVATESGISWLRFLGLVTNVDYQYEQFGGVTEEVENALHARQRHGYRGPTVPHVLQIVRSVPLYRQEWLGFAICFEPIPDHELDSMLRPSASDFKRLRSGTIDELDKIPTEEWKDWGTKHGVEKSIGKPPWTRIQ